MAAAWNCCRPCRDFHNFWHGICDILGCSRNFKGYTPRGLDRSIIPVWACAGRADTMGMVSGEGNFCVEKGERAKGVLCADPLTSILSHRGRGRRSQSLSRDWERAGGGQKKKQ